MVLRAQELTMFLLNQCCLRSFLVCLFVLRLSLLSIHSFFLIQELRFLLNPSLLLGHSNVGTNPVLPFLEASRKGPNLNLNPKQTCQCVAFLPAMRATSLLPQKPLSRYGRNQEHFQVVLYFRYHFRIGLHERSLYLFNFYKV